jgi:ABC-type uncharacterized transport system permease subunit
MKKGLKTVMKPQSWLRLMEEVVRSLLAVAVGLGIGGSLAWFAGESPWMVIKTIIGGALGTSYDRGLVIYFATLLMATGLSVAIPLKAGVFNIGSEGQTLIGAFCAAIAGLYIPLSSPLICGVMGFVAACVGAGVWGGLAAWIRAFRGGHEVISSIMLNFVAAGVTGWLVTEKFQAIDSQNPETGMIMSGYRLHRIAYFEGAPVTAGIFVTLGLVVLFFVVLTKSRAGIRLKATSRAPDAAAMAGYSVTWVRFWSFTLGAAVSGVAGAVMVMGEADRFRLGMSEGFGFLGIPVALLGKGRPLGVVWAAFLMAILHHGASALDLESTRVSRDLAQVIAALVVMAVIVIPEWDHIRRWWQQKRSVP